MYNKFVEVIPTSTENHIPHKTLSGIWDAPWVNRNIKILIKKTKRRYDKAKQSGTPEDSETFKEFRRFVQQSKAMINTLGVSSTQMEKRVFQI